MPRAAVTASHHVANRDFEAGPRAEIERDTSVSDSLARLDALANMMDSAVAIPGTNVVVGFDALLGLLPVIGDAISSAIGGYIILEARRLGASKIVIARMAANTTIDTVVGAIPIVGDVFDVAYRLNRKNVALLKRHIEKRGLGARNGRTIEGTFAAA
ncbi:MAG: DUF4112 domain-containing protein [Hyphomicrobium sp.]